MIIQIQVVSQSNPINLFCSLHLLHLGFNSKTELGELIPYIHQVQPIWRPDFN